MTNKGYELRQCAQSGSLDCIRELLAEGVNVDDTDSQGFTALTYAMNYLPHNPDKDHLAIVKLLVEAGADVNHRLANNQTPLYDAALEGLYDVVVYLIDMGADPTVTLDTGWTPLHELSQKQGGRPRNFTVIKKSNGNKVTITDADAIRAELGNHPDDEYASYLRTVQYMIEKGADVNARKVDINQTALFDAAGNDVPDFIVLFLNAGADVGARDKWGLTALHFACRTGALDSVKVLVEQGGTDVNAQENYGFTPLHEAAENGHLAVVKYLVKQGADKSIGLTKQYHDYKPGTTPLELARFKGHNSVVKFLSA